VEESFFHILYLSLFFSFFRFPSRIFLSFSLASPYHHPILTSIESKGRKISGGKKQQRKGMTLLKPGHFNLLIVIPVS